MNELFEYTEAIIKFKKTDLRNLRPRDLIADEHADLFQSVGIHTSRFLS